MCFCLFLAGELGWLGPGAEKGGGLEGYHGPGVEAQGAGVLREVSQNSGRVEEADQGHPHRHVYTVHVVTEHL